MGLVSFGFVFYVFIHEEFCLGKTVLFRTAAEDCD